MEHLGVDEALIGDLAERRRAVQSALWLWQQTFIAIVQRFVAVVQHNPARLGTALGVVALALSLPSVWMHVLWHYAVLMDRVWYPRSINWLARSSPPAVWQVVVFLQPWAWTYMAGWCVMLGVIAWGLVRLWPNDTNLILAVFLLSNISQSLPSLGRSVLDWSHQPANPMWISRVLSYAFFVFVAIPLSIHVGGRTGRSTTSYFDASPH